MAVSGAKIYLILYNVVQLFGWATLLTEIIRCATTKEDLWTVSSSGLKIFQTLALLEVVHTVVGLVKSGTLVTALQLSSRLIVLWLVLDYSQASRDSVGFPMLLVSWTLAEMIRYSFYLTSLLNYNLYPLTWLRYSMFLILYPIGITGELLVMYNVLPKLKSEEPLAVSYNGHSYNWSYYAMIVCMLTYIPVFPKLYGHMLAQRKKALSLPGGKSQKKIKRNDSKTQ